MADAKVTALSELAETPAAGDVVYIVDVSDTTDSTAGTSKKVTYSNLLPNPLPVSAGGTGAATLTGIVKGNGTSAMTAVTAPSGTIVGTSDTQTLTNKRTTKRVYTATNNASLTPEIDTYDIFHLTAMSAATTINNHSTSTPADGDMMLIRFLDNGSSRALSWGDAYVAKAGTALPTATTTSKNLSCLFQWNANLSKWNLLAAGLET